MPRGSARRRVSSGTSMNGHAEPAMFDELADVAATICSTVFEHDLELRLHEPIVIDPGYRHAVLRCRVVDPPFGVPASVIVKASNERGGHVFREWAALAFLSTFAEAAGVAPFLFGGDRERELLVLEDLGDIRGSGLRELLGTGCAKASAAALVATGRGLGRLHAATAGRRGAFDAFRRDVPEPAGGRTARGRIATALEALPERFAAHGVPLGGPALDDRGAARLLLNRPAGFEVLVHGDVAPSNLGWSEGLPRIVDFEASGYGCALLDGCYPVGRVALALDAGRLPARVRRDMLEAYRAALAIGCPAALDPARFGLALTSASLAWLAVLLESLPRVESDDRPRGPASWRQRILAGLEAFHELTVEYGTLERIGARAGDLAVRLRQRWGTVAPMPLFGAFVE